LALAAGILTAAILSGRAGAAPSVRVEPGKPSAVPSKAGGASAGSKVDDKYRLPHGLTRDTVTIECGDEYTLTADYHRREKFSRSMPGIIFIHAEKKERHEFYPLTFMTAGRGFASLAYDLRGHGENPRQKGNPPTTEKDLTDADWAMMLTDLRNVVSHLAMKQEVDGGRLALVGSGLGANLAIRAAAEPWAAAVRCVIAISPGLDIHGVKTEDAAALIPANKRLYLAAGKADAESFAAVNAIYAVAKGPKELYLVDSAERGNMLFGQGLFGRIQQWVADSLIEPGAKKPIPPESVRYPKRPPARKAPPPQPAAR
jgi:dienelactone hydrolase